MSTLRLCLIVLASVTTLFAVAAVVGEVVAFWDVPWVCYPVLILGAAAVLALIVAAQRRPWFRYAVLVLCLAAGGLACLYYAANALPDPLVPFSPVEPGVGPRNDLLVLVPGLGGSPETWQSGREALRTHGDVLAIRYPSGALSNADASAVALAISEAIHTADAARNYRRIVLMGHSQGALLARKAFLTASGGIDDPPENDPQRPWAAKVDRIVLLAGTNRGWDLSSRKPMDMGWEKYLQFSAGALLGRLTGTAQLIRATQSGAPFVANLRLEWMHWFRRKDTHQPEVVQLLGDIDDVVSDEDNQDLRASNTARFAWLRVRGTGHAEIIDFSDPTAIYLKHEPETLGAYRRDKVLRAVLQPFAALQRESEEQPFQTDEQVRHVVFVLHGIRDLGRWSAGFESALRARGNDQGQPDQPKLVIASPRYGFFGMGPFLLRPDRQKYVRWFMDAYTETIARYPKLERIDFVGHSNGTYLLASALDQYRSLKVRRIVFAGSVVRRDYAWDKVFQRGQVEAVQNYVADDDLVVALFPRFFEQAPYRFLGNDIGSGGFNGFAVAALQHDGARRHVQNIGPLNNGHSAFLAQIPPIVAFLVDGQENPSLDPGRTGPWKFASDYLCWALWIVLVAVIIGSGTWLWWRWGWQVGVLYVVFAIGVLHLF